ncbi:m7GpppX diphosphatase [Agrilus planipennis]|uniref:m7GpppX diphosphatase n=1 Tax=Agrilus planipennis TaxID=224129 RepID=A0A1W4WL15_AGRPL|nr:m7GpppX diphosphatase [Agrilus planipennis]
MATMATDLTTTHLLCDGSRIKKQKLDDDHEVNNIHQKLKNLSDFKVDKILHNNTSRKTVCVQGSFKELDGPAIVLLEKTAFQEEHVTNESGLFSEKGVLAKTFDNDIYGNYDFFPAIELNSIKTTVIHPATEKHIEKYSRQNLYLIEETPDIYNKIVLPHITAEQFDVQWVFNILEHKAETDRIICEDTDPEIGFVLVPDLKWNGSVETLYLLALIKKRGIKSLRDLKQEHLPLLRNIKQKCTEAIKSKYGLDTTQLRIYLHYQPSFYHLHIHFTYLRHEAPGITTERAHLLANIISNIELLPDYYQKVTIPFVVRESDKLYEKLKDSATSQEN